jgi:hypothetical protein
VIDEDRIIGLSRRFLFFFFLAFALHEEALHRLFLLITLRALHEQALDWLLFIVLPLDEHVLYGGLLLRRMPLYRRSSRRRRRSLYRSRRRHHPIRVGGRLALESI